jgi:hypothetical protein
VIVDVEIADGKLGHYKFLDAVQPSGISTDSQRDQNSLATAGKMPALQHPYKPFLPM